MKEVTADERDRILIAAFLQESLAKIERVISRALAAGRSLGELAVNLERDPDGNVRGGCAPREAVAQRWLTDRLVPRQTGETIAKNVRETPPTMVPVVLTMAHEGHVIYGVQRLEGDLVTPGKSN